MRFIALIRLPRRSLRAIRVSALLAAIACAAALAAGSALSAAAQPAPETSAAPPPAADPLWLRAVEIAGSNERWVPGAIYARIEEVDDEGSAKHVHESWMRLFLGAEGEVDTEIRKALEDGKDVTEKERKSEAEEKRRREQERARERERLEKAARERGVSVEQIEREEAAREEREGAGASLRFGGPTPFDPGVQDSVSAYRVAASDPPPGGPHAAFEFTQLIDGETRLRGVAWVEESTGTPIELRFAPDPLPKRVKEMSMRVRFAMVADTAWVPVEMEVNAMGKLLFFKKRYRSTLAFSDHWWHEGS